MSRQLLGLIALAALIPSLSHAQPPGPVRMIAEWEPIEGVLIRWPLGISVPLVAELAEDATVYVIITAGQIASATSLFDSQGVDMGNVEWFVADSWSHWSRDWGPQNLFDGEGEWGILDPWFDGYPWVPREVTGYEDDDDTPAEFAAYLGGENLWQPPFYLTGGNIMFDGHGRAFCSEAQVAESDHLSEAEFRAALQLWCGVDELVVLPNTEGYGIQHIDCVAKFLDEETVMVKQLDIDHADAPYVEQNAQILAGLTSCYGNPLEIHRVDCGPFGGTGMTAYTNSLILGKKVLVPTFNCAGDEPALQAYRDAMPGYEVIGFSGSWYYYDALHCRTMGIFDRGMLRVDVAPPPAEIPAAPWRVEALIDDRSEAGVDLAACFLAWRIAGAPDFELVPLSAIAGEADGYEGWTPSPPPGSELEYYVRAADHGGRVATRPIAAPEALYRCRVADDLTAADVAAPAQGLRAWPQPFSGDLRISGGGRGEDARVLIFDVRGRSVRELALSGGAAVWDGLDGNGRPTPAGVYVLKRIGDTDRDVTKVVRLGSH